MSASGPQPFQVPDHELLRVIGRGSYGEVWLARNALGTRRAVKIVRRSAFHSDRPFLREYSGIGAYEPVSRSHDGLVDVLQIGRCGSEDAFYYVMELADDDGGGTEDAGYQPATIEARLRNRGPMPVREALPVFQNLALAIGHLHAAGLLHRDIKPSNVIFVGGVAKLADIGLVAEAGGSATFVGTEGFIPPEGPGTASADRFALGRLMYETVTGLDRTEFPALPLDRNGGAQNRDLLEINAVMLRCCDPDPARRYQSADELVADLAILRSGQSVQDLRSYERRLRTARRAGLAAMVVVAGLLVLTIVIRRQQRLAQENFARSEQLRIRSETAERSAKDQLYSALVSQAAAERRTGLAGARQKALTALATASSLRAVTPEFRSEVASALALTDLTVARRVQAPTNAYLAITASPDGTLFARQTPGGDVELRDLATEALLRVLPKAGQEVGPFSTDGRWLATSGTNGVQRIWDVHAGTVRRLIAAGGPRLFAFGPRPGEFTAHRPGELTVETLSGTKLGTVPLPEPKPALALSGRGGLLAYGARGSNRVAVVRLPGGETVAELGLPAGVSAFSLGWSPDESVLAIGGANHRIFLWRPGETNAPKDLAGHGAEVVALNWSPDGRLLLSGSWDGTARLWDVGGAREAARHLAPAWHNTFLGDSGRLALFVPANHELLLCDVHFNEVCRELREPGGELDKSPFHSVFSPDSAWLFLGCHDGIRAFRPTDGRLVAMLPAPQVRDLFQFPAPARRLVAQSDRSQLLVEWNTNAAGEAVFGQPRAMSDQALSGSDPLGRPWLGYESSRLSLHYPDGRTVDLPTSSTMVAATLSPDGRWVVGSKPARAVYWEVGGRDRPPRFHDLGTARSYGVAFSRDSRRVYHATATDLCCTEAATGHRVWQKRLTEDPNFNTAIAESADGRLVAAVMLPFVVSLVDVQTGELVLRLEHPNSQPINDIAFSPDGNWFAVACSSHVTQLWDLRRLRDELGRMHAGW
jgi:WD40 repeat protein